MQRSIPAESGWRNKSCLLMAKGMLYRCAVVDWYGMIPACRTGSEMSRLLSPFHIHPKLPFVWGLHLYPASYIGFKRCGLSILHFQGNLFG